MHKQAIRTLLVKDYDVKLVTFTLTFVLMRVSTRISTSSALLRILMLVSLLQRPLVKYQKIFAQKPMYHLLETPVGVALFQKAEGMSLVARQLYSTIREAKKCIECTADIGSGTRELPTVLKMFFDTHLREGMEVSLQCDELGKVLSRMYRIRTAFADDYETKSLKKNAFKWFGINKDVYNSFSTIVAQKLAHQSPLESINGEEQQDAVSCVCPQELLNTIEAMEESINARTMRLREWYSIHFPELNSIQSHSEYLRLVLAVGRREELSGKSDEEMLALNIPLQVREWAKTSMGTDMSQRDIEAIEMDVKSIRNEMSLMNAIEKSLVVKVAEECPNITQLAGPMVTAKLIRKAGSLSALSQCAASTIQILGAEKAYNEALKTGGNTPKYGIIYECKLIAGAPGNKRGRVARTLAGKIALCARVDVMSEMRDGSYGKKMRGDIERLIERLCDDTAPNKPGKKVQKKRIISPQEYDHSRDYVKKSK